MKLATLHLLAEDTLVEEHDDAHSPEIHSLAQEIIEAIAAQTRKWVNGEDKPEAYHFNCGTVDIKISDGRTIKTPIKIDITPTTTGRIWGIKNAWANTNDTRDNVEITLHSVLNVKEAHKFDHYTKQLTNILYFFLEHEITHIQSTQNKHETYKNENEISGQKYPRQGREWESNLNAIRRYHKHVQPINTPRDLRDVLVLIGLVDPYTKSQKFYNRILKALYKRGILI